MVLNYFGYAFSILWTQTSIFANLWL